LGAALLVVLGSGRYRLPPPSGRRRPSRWGRRSMACSTRWWPAGCSAGSGLA